MCNGIGAEPSCGEGNQVQTRQCTDGTVDRCTDEDRQRNITCEIAGTALPDCPKLLEDWVNDGPCDGTGDDPTCGEGIQAQIRPCTDGTVDKCTDEDTRRNVACKVAGTALPDCRKFSAMDLNNDHNRFLLSFEIQR